MSILITISFAAEQPKLPISMRRIKINLLRASRIKSTLRGKMDPPQVLDH